MDPENDRQASNESNVETFVALLRGINVGGKHKLPMKDLAGIFVDSGAAGVQTVIQSGNVIFACDEHAPQQSASKVRAQIQDRFGFDTPVIVRSASEMAEVCESEPFGTGSDELAHLFVMFLSETPEPSRVALLDSEKFLPDKFSVIRKEIYLSLPTGAARTKLTNGYFDRTLSVISTSRNWRTVYTLAEITSERCKNK